MKPKISKWNFLKWGLAFLGLLIGAAIIDTLWIEPVWLKVRRIRRAEPSHYRVVHFTDFHFQEKDRPYAQRVIDAINRQHPDWACFTGDLIENTGGLEEALGLIRQIRCPVYGVPGNHEYWCQAVGEASAPMDPLAKTFAETGGAWLLDQSVLTRNGDWEILGWSRFHPGPIPPQRAAHRMLLTHYPELANRTNGERFDLVLAGHSHGGQIRIPFYGALLVGDGVGKYQTGLYPTPAGPLYVNPGIGTYWVRWRFNCRPEITVFEL